MGIEKMEKDLWANTYQRKAMRTLPSGMSEKQMLTNAALGLCGEAGEVADIVKKWKYQGHDLDHDAIRKELGDVLWYVAEACEGMGISMADIMHENIEKLKKRYPNGFDAERSRNREETSDTEEDKQ